MSKQVMCPEPGCGKSFSPQGIGPHRRHVHGYKATSRDKAEYNRLYRLRRKAEAKLIVEGLPRRKYTRRAKLPPIEPGTPHTAQFNPTVCPQCGFPVGKLRIED